MGQTELEGAIQIFTLNWKQQNHLHIYQSLICCFIYYTYYCHESLTAFKKIEKNVVTSTNNTNLAVYE